MREVESDSYVLIINHNLSYLKKNTSYLKISTLKVQQIPTLSKNVLPQIIRGKTATTVR